MKSYLTALVDKIVADAYTDNEVTGITFNDTSKLSVFNKHQFLSAHPKQIIGDKIKSVAENEEKISIEFQSGASIEIHLDSQSWIGPEAIELVLPNGQIIIWN
ncbi:MULTISPECIES: hypothetical protein [unclassified Pseudomonas]|uniref:hypothetical protein n=1 Tax=unclassified Pseudomonas TaxID=196821 RepID=UPI001BCF9702|nr:hypothetical protein [Pseudomonas sp. Pc102]BBP81494.1 hypothetical protein PHLH8_11360 [Pseudomonas sp. Pc102]